MVNRDFDALSLIRESVEIVARLVFPNENRESLWGEPFRLVLRMEPEEDLSLDAERQVETRRQRAQPWSEGQQQFATCECAFDGVDTNAATKRLPLQDLVLELELGALSRGQFEMRLDRSFGIQNPGTRFMDGDIAIAYLEAGKLFA